MNVTVVVVVVVVVVVEPCYRDGLATAVGWGRVCGTERGVREEVEVMGGEGTGGEGEWRRSC